MNLRREQFHLRREQSKGERDESNRKDKETGEIEFLPQGDLRKKEAGDRRILNSAVAKLLEHFAER